MNGYFIILKKIFFVGILEFVFMLYVYKLEILSEDEFWLNVVIWIIFDVFKI